MKVVTPFQYTKGDTAQMLQPLHSHFGKRLADVIVRHKIAFEHIHMGISAFLRDIY